MEAGRISLIKSHMPVRNHLKAIQEFALKSEALTLEM